MSFARTLLFACVGIFLCAGVRTARAADQPTPDPAQREASRLVGQALQAEAQGKADERAAAVQAALKVAPDYAPARWHAGQIRRGDRWVTVEKATQEAAASGKVDQYRQVRDRAGQTYNDQMALADWCKKNSLADQERAHLMLALAIQSDSRDAMSRLGLVRYRGQLIPREAVAKLDAQARQWDASVAQWKGRLQKLRTKAEGSKADDALAEIRAIRDPAAIPGLEAVFGAAERPASLAVVAALDEMPQQAATESLVRHAVFSKDDWVRSAAAMALRKRDSYSYMPLLLENLSSPITAGIETYSDGRGTSAYRLTLFREGTFANFAYSQTESFTPSPPALRIGRTVFAPIPLNSTVPTPSPTLLLAQAADTNARSQELNSRVTSAVATARYQEVSAYPDPTKLWDSWYDYNEYYTPEDPPTYSYTQVNYPVYQYVRRMSCFPAGTLVWTATGPMQIEKVKIGECVLSQNSETGELAYKPVLATTVRPASPLIEVRIGNSIIRSTRGHPYWVSGIGWQMAKELKAGQWLHTVRGPVLIDAAEPSYEDVCYNLVVADFNTYFVGDAQVLVHDNNLRGPNLYTVPGLANE